MRSFVCLVLVLLTLHSTAQIAIHNGTTMYIDSGMAVNSTDEVTVVAGGTLHFKKSTLYTKGNFTTAGTIIGNTATFGVVGSSEQTLSGTFSIKNFIMNNAGGAVIANGSTVNILGTYLPTLGALIANGGLVFKSSDTATARVLANTSGNPYITGNVVAERYTNDRAARKSIFLSSPVIATIANSWQQQIYVTGPGTGGTPCNPADANSPAQPTTNNNGFDATQANQGTVFNYNTDNSFGNRWVTIGNTSFSFTPGMGHRVLVRGTRLQGCVALINTTTDPSQVTFSATGVLAQGNVDVPLQGDGYTLVGNAYQCEISFAALQTTNNTVIDNKYWTYNPVNPSGIYTTWDGDDLVNGGSLTNPDRIAIGQSFFVQNTGGTDQTVTAFFRETHKTADEETQTGFFRPGNWAGKIRVALRSANNNHLDETLIRFNDNPLITTGYNKDWDSYSISEGSQLLGSLKAGDKLAIQTRPATYTNDTVPLFMSAASAGNFKLNFTEHNNIASQIFLLDTYSNTIADVKLNSVYDFSVNSNTASQGSNRFKIIFKQTTVLPVDFITLSAKIKNNGAEVNWKVPQEKDMLKYEVQRSSNGTSFNMQGSVMAKGNSISQLNYTWFDVQPVKENVYYRIKGIGREGTVKYSSVVRLSAAEISTLTIYPNPVINELNIMFDGNRQWLYSIKIIDAKGVTVWRQNGLNVINNILQVNTSGLGSGIYFIDITCTDGYRATRKFIK